MMTPNVITRRLPAVATKFERLHFWPEIISLYLPGYILSYYLLLNASSPLRALQILGKNLDSH